jgi:hypothetical protein
MSLPTTLDYHIVNCPECGGVTAAIGLIAPEDSLVPVYELSPEGEPTDNILDGVTCLEIELDADEITELVNELNEIKIRLLREERLAALGRPFD